MKILTFNWHESYIHLLAKTGFDFDVVERWKGGRYGWIKEFRPVPPNCMLIGEEEARARLKAGGYDRVIGHNINDILFVIEYSLPKILVFHNRLSTEIALGDNRVDRDEYLSKFKELIDASGDITLVFISKSKRDDWGLEGEVIPPGIDASEYGGWNGDEEKVLRIGNLMMERDIMLGYSLQERIIKGLPSTILGLNPKIPSSYIPSDWDELKSFMRSHRVYLNTTIHPYEDGYNLALLEAMATGMPVVSIGNPTSPIIDGINGFISDDEGYLIEKIKTLLSDRSLARTMGERARESVMEFFPMEDFLIRWKNLLESHESSVCDKGYRKEKIKILMSYASNPQTTAAYMENALRKVCDVVTYGPRISEETLKLWNLEKIKDMVRDHNIPYLTPDIREVFDELSRKWVPDLFLWIETGVWYPLEGIDRLPCPKACYLIDSHFNLDKHLEIARDFDYVFIAQKRYIDDFRKAGIERVFWLPLACDPEIHGKKETEKLYDIGFVGSLNSQKRVDILNRLKERFNLYYERCFLESMAEVFSKSRIVFNISAKDDLNMRVFEALCSGSMLLADEAPGSGLTEFFEDRKHLVIYRDEDELLELAHCYLENEEERERIAAEGRNEVLAHHTYDHRVREMLDIIGVEKNGNNLPVIQINESDMENTNDYYSQERADLKRLIPGDAKKILDIGCGEGELGKRLLDKGAEVVVGIELVRDVAEKAKRNLSRVICGDVEEIDLPFEDGYFDCIVFGDVLEHLKDPLTTLKRLKRYLSNTGVVVASIPNVRHHYVINMLVEGHWRYEDWGILDRGHLRFFTFKEIEALFKEAGFEITGRSENIDEHIRNIDIPESGDISFGRIVLRDQKSNEMEELFVIQYLIRAEKREANRERFLMELNGLVEERMFEDAVSMFERHLKLHPGDIDALYRYAELCFMLGKKDKTREMLERVLVFKPDMKEASDLLEKVCCG